jgi:sugar phosphate isomerase/epimerase
MQIGIFTKTFVRPTLGETLDAVKQHGLGCVQFNMSCAGVPPMPDRIDPDLCDRIRHEMAVRGLTMAAVSGTFNMIHPDLRQRRTGLRRLRELASVCTQLGTSVITLCTGTRDPDDMWRRHPENDLPEAWQAMVTSMREAVKIAGDYDVTLAFEPEVSNVVDSAKKGRRLLDEIGSARLKVVMDGANIFHAGELPRMREILDEAFDLLGKEIVIAHAKDLDHDGEAGHEAAGKGLLDYDAYLSLLHAAGFDGPLILHGLGEFQVEECVTFLRQKLGNIIHEHPDLDP